MVAGFQIKYRTFRLLPKVFRLKVSRMTLLCHLKKASGSFPPEAFLHSQVKILDVVFIILQLRS